MKLYFDIGNTNIKINFNYNGKEYYNAYQTKYPYTVDSFYNLLPNEIRNSNIEEVMICSVVPKIANVIEGVVKKYWQIKPKFLAFPLKTGIKINATEPKKTGADIVALAAFVSSVTDNGIIVNMGTATTITHVKNKTIQGVIILPGFETSKNALLANAEQLNDIKLYLPKGKVLGNSTAESISIGMLMGHVHMIRGLVKDIDKDSQIYLSGGKGRTFKNLLPEFIFVKEATIKGLKAIGRLNEKI